MTIVTLQWTDIDTFETIYEEDVEREMFIEWFHFHPPRSLNVGVYIDNSTPLKLITSVSVEASIR